MSLVSLKIPPYTNRDGSTSHLEHQAIFLVAQSQECVGKYALEIGTFYGDRTNVIASALPQHHVYTVDIPPMDDPKLNVDEQDPKYFGRTPYFCFPDRVSRLLVDSFDLCLNIDEEIGFSFVDGSHSYEYAKNDFLKCVHYSAPNALVMFHDYDGWPGVTRFIDEASIKLPDWKWKRLSETGLVWCSVMDKEQLKTL